jgi:hypothetical protein
VLACLEAVVEDTDKRLQICDDMIAELNELGVIFLEEE